MSSHADISYLFAMKICGLSAFSWAALLALLAPAPLALAQSFNFTFTDLGANVIASGSFTVSAGVVTTGNALVNGIDGFLPGTFANVVPTTFRALDGSDMIIDNLFSGSNPVFNGNGVGFGSGFIDATHYDYGLNIWGNGPGS